jgi:hypothetical protein
MYYSGKRPTGRLRRRWEGIITIDPTEIDCEDGKWMELTRVVVQMGLAFK